MTIGINGYFLSRPYTGFGNYTIGLIKGLNKLDKKNHYLIFTPEPVDMRLARNFSIRVVRPCHFLGKSLAKIYWEQWQIMRQAQRLGCDFVHHFYPVTSIFSHGLTQLASVHDVIPWNFQEYNYSWLARVLRKFTKWSCQRASAIITVSHTSAEDIIRTFGIGPEKIKVIYNGYDPIFNRKARKAQPLPVKAQSGAQPPYIFYLGGFDARKNVSRLIEAFAEVAPKTKAQLVLAGGVFSPQREIYQDYYQLPEQLKKLGLEKKVVMLGTVPTADLPALYQGAEFFISPTLAEGFNIPVLEAFASGTAVACSRTSATAELARDCALLFDPQDTKVIAQAILTLLKDQKLRQKLARKGKKRAQDFSWVKSAQELLAVYQGFDK